jgi:hypothetical protein
MTVLAKEICKTFCKLFLREKVEINFLRNYCKNAKAQIFVFQP